jgi:N6-adenosine-specific RNA methylase IME4
MKPRGDLRIDPEFKALIAPLSDDERAQLEANLVADGCRDPLTVWGQFLLDGHNRHEICARRGIPFRVVSIMLADRQAARIWIRWNQLGRRNLTDDQRAGMTVDLLEELAAQSKRAKASVAGKVGGRTSGRGRIKKEIGSAATSTAKPITRDRSTEARVKVSKRAGVSQHKIRQAATLKKRSPELHAKVKAGEMPLAQAVRATKPAVRAEQLATTIWPSGKYGVILGDPPWKPDAGVLDPSRRIENQYPTLALPQLIALRPRIDELALEDCVLLLWTTTQKLADAVTLINAWGFDVKSGAVWVKDRVGMGYWFRGRHELLILATRGKPRTPLEAHRPDSVIAAPRRGHSEKPSAVYELVEQMFPQVPKVEIFARATRSGWALGTNETTLRSA